MNNAFRALLVLLLFPSIVTAAGTTVFNESGYTTDSWAVDDDALFFQFNVHYHSDPYGCDFVNAFSNSGSAEHAINLSGYDAAVVSFYASDVWPSLDQQLTLRYNDGSWKELFSLTVPANTDNVFSGSISLSTSATSIQFVRHNPGAIVLDDIIVTGDKRPSLTSNSISPSSGFPGYTFQWSVVYTDGDNDPPAYVRLHVMYGGTEISGSPFTMTQQSGSYISGATYVSPGMTLPNRNNDYTYYIETSDGWLQNNTSTFQGPIMLNNFPVLSSGSVLPVSGSSTTVFTWAVTCADADGDHPYSGYPKVHVQKGGNEISGSPFTMSYISGSYTTGALYSCSRTLSEGLDYTYYFETKEGFDLSHEITSSSASGPTVTNSVTVKNGYSDRAVNPLNAAKGTSFVYRAVYSDDDGNAPKAGYPKLHIYKSGVEISSSPCTMQFVNGNYVSGATYQYSVALSTGIDYSYLIEAMNGNNSSAVPLSGVGPYVKVYVKGYVFDPAGDPMPFVNVALTGSGSDYCLTNGAGFYQLLISTQQWVVTPSSSAYFHFSPSSYTYSKTVSEQNQQNFTRTNSPPVLSWAGGTGYESDSVEPDHGSSGDYYTFKIKYSDADNDAAKTGYPRLHVKKDGNEIAGSPFIMTSSLGDPLGGMLYTRIVQLFDVSNQYTYSFEAYDRYGASSYFDSTPVITVNTDPPTIPVNTCDIADGKTTISRDVALRWSASDLHGRQLLYTLYVSQPQDPPVIAALCLARIPGSLSPVFSGTDNSFTVRNCMPGKWYSWQVRAENSYGAYSVSPMFTFKVFDVDCAKTFNYPNPFNPNREQTHIVFKVQNAQMVAIKVYSEYGDLVFEDSMSAAAGVNEYLYQGKDGNGNTLYNGSYICRIEKQEGVGTCYLLIIK